MEKEFDFENIGKRMPYEMPEGYMSSLEEKIAAKCTEQKKPDGARRIRLWTTAIAIAAMLTGVIFVVSQKFNGASTPDNYAEVKDGYTEMFDQMLDDMSDEELSEYCDFVENDIFIN